MAVDDQNFLNVDPMGPRCTEVRQWTRTGPPDRDRGTR